MVFTNALPGNISVRFLLAIQKDNLTQKQRKMNNFKTIPCLLRSQFRLLVLNYLFVYLSFLLVHQITLYFTDPILQFLFYCFSFGSSNSKERVGSTILCWLSSHNRQPKSSHISFTESGTKKVIEAVM